MFDLTFLLEPRTLVQIAILWLILYGTVRYLETTVAGGFLKSVGLVLALAVIAAIQLFNTFNLAALREIFTYLLVGAFFSIVIIFQPELRHGLTRLGRSPLARALRRFGVKTEDAGHSVADEVMKAARRFSKNHVGSLVVLEREVSLQPYVDRAIRVDAAVKAELLDTIFSTPTLLHDGAVIIRGERLLAAGAVLPLTQNPNLPTQYGTRHRAAVGISEESDAVVVVTSEETGTISIVLNGELKPQEDTVKAEEALNRLLAGEDVEL